MLNTTDGGFLVLWFEATRNSNDYRLPFIQKFTSDGSPVSPPTKIVDTASDNEGYSGDLIELYDGSIYVAWNTPN